MSDYRTNRIPICPTGAAARDAATARDLTGGRPCDLHLLRACQARLVMISQSKPLLPSHFVFRKPPYSTSRQRQAQAAPAHTPLVPDLLVEANWPRETLERRLSPGVSLPNFAGAIKMEGLVVDLGAWLSSKGDTLRRGAETRMLALSQNPPGSWTPTTSPGLLGRALCLQPSQGVQHVTCRVRRRAWDRGATDRAYVVVMHPRLLGNVGYLGIASGPHSRHATGLYTTAR